MKNTPLRSFLVSGAFVFAGVIVAGANEPAHADLGTTQTDVGEKRFQTGTRDIPMHPNLMQQRRPLSRWHAEYSSIGRRKAPFSVEESRPKNIRQPEVISYPTLDFGKARQDGQLAYVRNFDNVHETHIVRRFQDAEVGSISDADPDVQVEERDFAMRDVNRFSFQRNHSQDPGIDRVRAGGESESQDRSSPSGNNRASEGEN